MSQISGDLWLVGSLANWLVAIIAQKFLCGAASLATRQNFKGTQTLLTKEGNLWYL